jgi:hypothetical protein
VHVIEETAGLDRDKAERLATAIVDSIRDNVATKVNVQIAGEKSALLRPHLLLIRAVAAEPAGQGHRGGGGVLYGALRYGRPFTLGAARRRPGDGVGRRPATNPCAVGT